MKSSETIWKEYHTKLAAFIKSKVAEDVADDLLQDVFVKIHSRMDSLKEDARLESWIYQITRNTIIDYYRLKKTETQFPDWITKDHPQEETVRKELSACLEPMIYGLPDKYRDAMLMSEIQNMTQKEVAQKLGISLSGAKSRVQRGRGLLKEMLHDCCEFELSKDNQVVSYQIKGQNCKKC